LQSGIDQLDTYFDNAISGKGNGTSSSSSTAHIASTVDKLKDTLDVYREINLEISKLDDKLSALQDEQEDLYGNDLVNNYAE
jgi:hypothetical protein